MRRYSMSDRAAWTRLRPASRRDWHQIRVVIGYIAVSVAFVAGIFLLKHRRLEVIEQNWKCATALIEDVRPRLIEQVNTARGGAILYEVSILAKYTSEGIDHERWISVEQPPVTLAEAQLQTFQWKGQQCVVRWNSSKPDQVIAEVS